MNLDLLIARMRAALVENPGAVTLRALAEEYAELCVEANRRLESCLPLLRAGQKYAALQIAETAPVLLDQIARLAFDGMDAWRQLCREHDLPLPPNFDPQLISEVNTLYDEKIDASHPLYRDYRAAMRLRDEMTAVGVLDAILRINPEDDNAQSERLRLLPRVRARIHEELGTALARKDIKALTRLLAMRKHSDVVLQEDVATWDKAAETVLQEQTQRAETKARALLEALPGAYEREDWPEAMKLLADWHTLSSDFSDSFAQAHEAQVRPIIQWADGIAQQRMREQVRKRLFAQTEELLAQGDGAAQNYKQWEGQLAQWEKILEQRKAARIDEWPPELETQMHARIQRLKQQRARRRFQLLAFSVACFAAMLIWGVIGVRSFVQHKDTQALFAQAQQLRDEGDALALKQLLGLNAPLVQTSQDWQDLQRWGTENAAAVETLQAEINELAGSDLSKLADDSKQLELALQQCDTLTRALEKLPRKSREQLAQKLEHSRRAFSRALDALSARTHTETLALITQAEELGARAQTLDTQQWARYAELVKRLQPLQLDAELAGRFEKAKVAFERDYALYLKREEDLRKLEQSADFDSYFDTLLSLKENALTTQELSTPMQDALLGKNYYARLLQLAIAPEDSVLWDAVQSSDVNLQFVPASPNASENLPISRLFGDKYLQNIMRRTLSTIEKDGSVSDRETIYTTELFEEEKNNWSGGREVRQRFEVLDEKGEPHPRATRLAQIKNEKLLSGTGVTQSELSAESLLMEKLRRYFDARTNLVRGPLLEGLDVIRADKDASPLFKAALHLQWMRAMKARPSLWGLSFCPRAEKDALELSMICGENLGLYFFTSQARRDRYEKRLAEFYARTQGSYYAQARAQLTEKLSIAREPARFAGYTRANGTLNLLPQAAGHILWYRQGNQPTPRVYDRAHPPALPPYTPVFMLPKAMQDIILKRKEAD